MKTVFLIIGTRPDTIKMAPIYHALRQQTGLTVRLITTGQHRDLLASALASFNMHPDISLEFTRVSQSLTELTTEMLRGLEAIFLHQPPDLVLTHGDTSTCYAASLACFYHKIPFHHIEAGLRSHHIHSPFPEEFHRRAISLIASHHFAPTDIEQKNLMREGVKNINITVTGSTVHEAMQLINYLNDHYFNLLRNDKYKQVVTLTMHRRENTSQLQPILNTIKNIARQQQQCVFVFPVHPNPYITKVSGEIFQDMDNVMLTSPLDYQRFISLLHHSDLILTDSGGIQEEAAYLGKNVFILRDQIERFDGVNQGYTKVVGIHPEQIESEVLQFLRKPQHLQHPPEPEKPPKTASAIIADFIASHLI